MMRRLLLFLIYGGHAFAARRMVPLCFISNTVFRLMVPELGPFLLDCFVFLCVCFCAVWGCLCFPLFRVFGWGHSWVFFCCLQLLDFSNLVSLGFLGLVGFRSISHVLARSMGLRHDVILMCLIESGVFNIIACGRVQVHG